MAAWSTCAERTPHAGVASTALIAPPRSGRRPRGRRREAAPRTGAHRGRVPRARSRARAPARPRCPARARRRRRDGRRRPHPARGAHRRAARGRSVRTRTRSGRSSISARSSRKSPAAASRPRDMTRTREPIRSTSARTWLDTITHRPSRAEADEELDQIRALAGIEAGQRLVEDEHGGIVDDRLGDLHALAHALRVGGQRARVGGIEPDRPERVLGGLRRLGEPVQLRGEADELARGEPLEDVLLLRDEPDRARDEAIGSRVTPEHAHRALRRPGEAAQHPEHRRLARAVRAEERSHARADVEAHVRDGDERAEPLRDAVRDDARLLLLQRAHRKSSIRRYRSQQTRSAAAAVASRPPVMRPVERS